MKKYLISGKYINWDHPDVLQKAQELAEGCDTDEAIAKSCFSFVRDAIQHSIDFKRNPVTVKASEALQHKTGFCYSKSHLLAALLRANNIPAGLCYQRLTIEEDKPSFCLHSLNAVFLKRHGWYRLDARGNKQGVDARFCPPEERLAFRIIAQGECDIQGIWPEPLPLITESLEKYSTYLEVSKNLPDIEIVRTI